MYLLHDAVYVSVLEMGVFCMVSKEINGYIMDYVSSQPWKNKMIIRSFHHSTTQENTSTIQHYRDLSEFTVEFPKSALKPRCEANVDSFCVSRHAVQKVHTVATHKGSAEVRPQ